MTAQPPDATPEPGVPERRRREGRLARHARHARTIWREPRAAGPLLRGALIDLWRSRGGGFYGLGYLITFLVLEARMVVGEFAGATTLMGFVSEQLLEYIARLGIMSLVNVVQALIWPLLLLSALGGWGLVVLAVGYVGFERLLRPQVEALFPELAQASERRRERKARRQRRKQARADGRAERARIKAERRKPAGSD